MKAFLMVRWQIEGLSDMAEQAVIFAETSDEAKMLAAHVLYVGRTVDGEGRRLDFGSTTTSDWDAREVRDRRALRAARNLSRSPVRLKKGMVV